MTTYVITVDGEEYEIDAPDDMPESKVMEEFNRTYQQQTQPQAQPSDLPPDDVKPEPEYESDWLDRVRAAGQGASMGWSDEAGVGLAALGAKGAQLFNDDETSLGDIYDQMKGTTDSKRKAYEEANPGEALALNLGGGLLTGGIGAAKTMASQGFKNAGKLGKTLRLMGLGGAEGAVAGAGASGQGLGESLGGAGVGAGIGALIPGGMATIGKFLDTATVRRVGENLVDAAGNFMPINQLLDEGSRLGSLFQKTVGESWGGQQLREQNRTVLEKAMSKAAAAESATEYGKTIGKKVDEKALRDLVKSESLPDYVSPEFLEKIKNADAHDAIKMVDEAWNTGFDVVKKRKFNINPTQLTDEIVDGMDTPMDSQYASQIKALLQKKLKGGFTPNKGDPSTAYSTKGLGSVKNPKVDLEDGVVDGDWLMQARNDFRMQANDLEDAGQSALEVHALKGAAGKIDDLIRKSLNKEDLDVFNKELNSWGNFQAGRRATRNAGQTKQGEYTPENLLGADKVNQTRNFDIGDAPFQTEAQKLQVDQLAKVEALREAEELAKKTLTGMEKKAPNLNPSAWTKGFNSAILGLPAAPFSGFAVPPVGYGVGKLLSTEGAQKAVAGQTEMQKTIAALLRQFEGSEAQKAMQAGSNVYANEAIMNITGD